MSKILRFDDEDGNHLVGASDASESGLTRVIVKVNTEGYVPTGFRVRTRIDDELFTAETTEADLATAADDPHVESIARAHRLDLI